MAETNTAALRAQGERDARALTVTGRRRADTGRIRRAAKALARMARTVTPETPNGQWLRDNRSFAAAAAGDAAAAGGESQLGVGGEVPGEGDGAHGGGSLWLGGWSAVLMVSV